MIIHKKPEDKLPHEGLEYFFKSKEPESRADCVGMWCWECIFNTFNVPCNKMDEFKNSE